MNLTVIIPIYNAQKHLERCINSVLSQHYGDFELLLVNDGSTDRSVTICEQFAEKDKRIKIFHQVNGGVSAARNKGIENAAGEWITFIDADDYVQENYFDVLNLQTKTDWIHLRAERAVTSDMGVGINFENQAYKLTEFVKSYSLYPHFPEVWAKFFKTSIIRESNLRFNTHLKFGEDSLFNLQYLKFCRIISTSNISKYVYKNDEDGLSKLTQDIKNDTTLFKEIEKELEQNQYPSRFCEQAIRIPLIRYLKILYHDKSISTTERRVLLKKSAEKYYRVVMTVYTNPKIRLFFILAHLTGVYSVLDFVLSRINK